MRLIRYFIINKETKTAIYTECRRDKAQAFLNGLADKENYTIASKWMSI